MVRWIRARLARDGRLLLASLALVACASDEGARVEAVGGVAEPGDATTSVSLTFDDATSDQLQAGALLAKRAMHATFYVSSGRLGTAGHLAWGDVARLEADGNEIGGHTIDHVDLTTLDPSAARREVCVDRSRLLAAGLAIADFAYPFGAMNADVEALVAGCGYASARKVSGLVSPTGCKGCPYANAIPPADAYAIRTPQSIGADTTLAQMETGVTQAEDHGGGWVPFVFHRVCDGCSTAAITPAQLAAFLDWLAARAARGTVVRTVREVIGGPVAPAPNLLSNGSLEDDGNGDGVPDCWKRTGFGGATFAWATTGDAHDGRGAQRLSVTSWTSGARRLASAQDLGACAPAAAAGDAFGASAWYHSDVPARFAAYYRDSSGRWTWWAESPVLPATASYARAAWTVPALPDGAQAVGIALGIAQVGSITMDSFALDAR